jgi:hypothetical protein
MRGQEILNNQIGNSLKAGRIISFYNEDELEDSINSTLLNFGNEWLRIVCTDERTWVEEESDDISKYNYDASDGFKFVIQPIEQLFPEFNKYINKRLLGIKELVLRDYEYMSFGLNLYFEDSLCFTIRNHDYPIDQNEFLFEKIEFKDLIEK